MKNGESKVIHEIHRPPVDIVLIEDDEPDVAGFQRALKVLNAGHRLHVARDPVEGLELIHSLVDNRETHSILTLMDINLPKMSGLELLERLRGNEKLANLLVFIWTTSDDEKDRQKAAELDVAGYLVKKGGMETFATAVTMLQNSALIARK